MTQTLTGYPRELSKGEDTRRMSERYRALTSGMLWASGFPGAARLRFQLCVAIRERWIESQKERPGHFA